MIHRKIQVRLASIVVCLAAIGSVAVQTEAYAQTAESKTTQANNLPEPDKSFVQAATMASSNEITASNFAMDKAHNASVETFARKMIVRHRIMEVKLKAAVPLAARAPTENVDQSVVDSLKDKQSDDFIKTYIKTVALDGHKQAIAAFENEAKNGKVSSLKKFAAASLPELRDHYKLAQALAKQEGVAE